jgi:hypothetical protein
MNEEIYHKSLQTNELQLSHGNKLSHYGIVVFSLFVSSLSPIIHLIKYIQGEGSSFISGEIWIIIIPFILCILFYWLQKSRLKFEIVDTRLTHAALISLIEVVSEKLEWQKVSSSSEAFIAKTNPSFFSGSWGEQITILFDKDRILINSICDLDKRSSLVSFGRNKRNVNTLKESIEQAGK